MLRLGEWQELLVVKEVDFGVYLGEEEESEIRVLLPKKMVGADIQLHSKVEVFLYKDSSDRLIATRIEPKITLDKIAVLKVKEVTRIGAFLDWGLEKDLFLPYKEMTQKVQEEDEVLVRLYIDKSERLCASMWGLYDYLKLQSPYVIGDEVTGRIYEFSDNFGTFVAVDDCYSAMIKRHESCKHLRIGDVVSARVVNVKEDGKLDITLREKSYIQMDDDASKVLEIMESYSGVLPFTDKATPEVIMRETGLSKAAFKRAVGRLYKERKIVITETAIRMNQN